MTVEKRKDWMDEWKSDWNKLNHYLRSKNVAPKETCNKENDVLAQEDDGNDYFKHLKKKNWKKKK